MSKKTASLLLFFASILGAQITGITPTSYDVTNLQWGPSGPGVAVTIQGTGAWELAANPTPCFTYHYSANSGTAPQTIFVVQKGAYGNLGAGAVTCRIDFQGAGGNTGGPFTLTINTTGARYNQPFYYTNGLRVADASLPTCAKPANEWINTATCTSADSRPGGNWTPPAMGGWYRDPDLGGQVRRLVTGRYFYSSRPAINLDNTYIMMESGIYSMTTGALVYNLPGSCEPFWSSRVANKIYCPNEDSTIVTAYSLVTPPNATSLGTVYSGNPWAYKTGGTTRPSTIDHFPVFKADATAICAIDMTGTNSRWCADISALELSSIDYLSISPTPDSDGYYYVVTNAAPPVGTPNSSRSTAGQFIFRYRPTDAELTNITPDGIANLENPASDGNSLATWQFSCGPTLQPTKTPYCFEGSHSDIGNALGQPVRVDKFQSEAPNYHNDGQYRILSLMPNTEPVEFGGGFKTRMFAPFEYIACAADGSPVCTTAGVLPIEVTNRKITNCTGSSPVTCTTDAAHTWTNGQAVFIDGVAGITGVNGRQTLATASGSSFTINVATTGTYTSSTGGVVADSVTTNWNLPAMEVNIVNLATGMTRRVAKTKQQVYNNLYGVGTYAQYNFGGISGDGKYANFMTNQGYLQAAEAYIIPTGFNVNRWTRANDFDKDGNSIYVFPGDTQAVVKWSIPEYTTCSVNYSTNTDVASPTTVTTGAGKAFQTVLTSLSANTQYYGYIVCDNYHFARMNFKTLPATAEARSVYVQFSAPSNADNVLVHYGITSALSSNTSFTCTAGVCKGTLSGTTGDPLYVRPTYRTAANLVISAGAVQIY